MPVDPLRYVVVIDAFYRWNGEMLLVTIENRGSHPHITGAGLYTPNHRESSVMEWWEGAAGSTRVVNPYPFPDKRRTARR